MSHVSSTIQEYRVAFDEAVFFKVLSIWTRRPEHVVPPVASARIVKACHIQALSRDVDLDAPTDLDEALTCSHIQDMDVVDIDDGHRDGYDTLYTRVLEPRRKAKDSPFTERVRFSFAQGAVWFIPGTGECIGDIPLSQLPFYYPKVACYMFSYRPIVSCDYDDDVCDGPASARRLGEDEGVTQMLGLIRVSAIYGTQSVDPSDDRVEKGIVALKHLLKRLDDWGNREAKGYVPKAIFDTLFSKEMFAHEYTALKDKYRCLIQEWPEKTDPHKYVFEDVAIVAYIKLLWRHHGQCDDNDIGRSGSGKADASISIHDSIAADDKWLDFVDLGCGNGLLTFLLTCEGFTGIGYDPQLRRVWTEYDRLRVEYHLGDVSPRYIQDAIDADVVAFPEARWIIGNHADELTPWIPVIAARSHAGFVSLPCCLFDFYSSYTNTAPNQGRYEHYCSYILGIERACGFDVCHENVRIPALKNVIHSACALSSQFDSGAVDGLIRVAWQRARRMRHQEDGHAPEFLKRKIFTPVGAHGLPDGITTSTSEQQEGVE